MMDMLRQSVRFGAVGVVNTSIGLAAIYALMFFVHASAAVANAVGYAIGLAVSFVLNKSWTFQSTQPIRHVLPRYILTAGVCYLLNLGVVLFCIRTLHLNAYLAQFLGVGIYTSCMFLSCRWFVFAACRVPTKHPT